MEEAKKKNFKPFPGLRIAKEVAVVEAKKDKNFVLSPICIQLGLSLLANGAKDSILLSFLGGIWIDQSLSLNPKFLTDAQDIYKAKVDTVDFQYEANGHTRFFSHKEQK
ncbi:hypothetical protein FRX31_012736 [Thalictrum thalictroides]|uniref:Serpin domain-containing protein n=1 Tax=Thalictrum thalictroides TaxID=46969 RepID=A0A7J6WL69_THATH|nr:hypothetical protein FRX31_012736 [Thalictrum thalictroides]